MILKCIQISSGPLRNRRLFPLCVMLRRHLRLGLLLNLYDKRPRAGGRRQVAKRLQYSVDLVYGKAQIDFHYALQGSGGVTTGGTI